jgi:phosphoribosyl-dephospho-CoA transferase
MQETGLVSLTSEMSGPVKPAKQLHMVAESQNQHQRCMNLKYRN